MPIHSTQIVRMDGLMLAASVETQNVCRWHMDARASILM